MTAVRRVFSPQDAHDLARAAAAVNAKESMPVSKVRGKTRGRHRAHAHSVGVQDLDVPPGTRTRHPRNAPCPKCQCPQWLHTERGCIAVKPVTCLPNSAVVRCGCRRKLRGFR